jgi:transcriptional regulator with XRE-family HTH domain
LGITPSQRVLLRDWRQKRGYSIRGLAKAAGVSYVSIIRVEQGQTSPTVAWLAKVAGTLGISVRDFFPLGKRRGRGK